LRRPSALIEAEKRIQITLLYPGQHSVSSESLKVVFEKSAEVIDKQIILLTSIQKVLIKDGHKEIDARDLDSLLVNSNADFDYHIYRLPEVRKSITMLPNS
jgi:hypothetical protein